MSLLDDAADWFKAREKQPQAYYSDDVGRYAFGVTVMGQSMIVVGKSYLHEGRASFMREKVVDMARHLDALVLLFTKNGDRLLFNPQTIHEHGEQDDPVVTSRQQRREDWVTIPVTVACDFDAWADGEATPQSPGEAADDGE